MPRLTRPLSFTGLLVVMLIAWNGCGGGGGGSGGSTPPPTIVTIGLNSFNPATCGDFSLTPIGALLETMFRYRISDTTDPAETFEAIYERLTVTVSGVALPCWFDGVLNLWAIDTTGAVRTMGTARKDPSTGVLIPRVQSDNYSFLLLPGGTLADGQTFVPIPQPLSPLSVSTVRLNQTSRVGATGCIMVLTALPYGTEPHQVNYQELWIAPGMGALWRESYILRGSPTSEPDTATVFQPFSG